MSKSSFFKICPNLEGQLVVDGGHLGGHVDRSGGVDDEVLDRLVPVSLPARHQIEDELEKDIIAILKKQFERKRRRRRHPILFGAHNNVLDLQQATRLKIL